MINEERAYLMTQMARYEQKKAGYDLRIGNHFRGDYLSGQLLESFFCATIVYAAILAVYVLYHFEEMMVRLYGQELQEFLKQAGLCYVLFLVVFLLITALVYNRRYKHAVDDLNLYYKALDKLAKEYEQEK